MRLGLLYGSDSVRFLQPSEVVEPPPSSTLKALAVIRAIQFGREKFVSDWLKRDPTLLREQCPLTGMTPLLAIIWSPTLSQAAKVPLVEWLLLHGADLEARDWQGRCALQLAYPDVELMTLLLERGAWPKPFFLEGSRVTLLSAAASDGEIPVLRLLLEWHAKSGPLFTAAELDEALAGSEEGTAAELLIQNGAKSEVAPVNGGTPIAALEAPVADLVPLFDLYCKERLQWLRGDLHAFWRGEHHVNKVRPRQRGGGSKRYRFRPLTLPSVPCS
jgi:hypothetical protein